MGRPWRLGRNTYLLWIVSAVLTVVTHAGYGVASLYAIMPSWMGIAASLFAAVVLDLSGATRYGRLHMCVPLIVFVAMCALSILLADIPPVFRPWPRLANLLLLLMVVSPLFTTSALVTFRRLTFSILMLFAHIVVILSFAVYLFEYMAYDAVVMAFSGVTVRGMTLSPLAAVSLLASLSRMLRVSRPLWRASWMVMVLIAAFIMFVSGSRIAIVGAIVGAVIELALTARRSDVAWLMTGMTAMICMIGVLRAPMLDTVRYKMEIGIQHGSMTYSRDSLWADRMVEFSDSPVTGVGFCNQTVFDSDFSNRDASLRTGSLEPGGVWCSVMAMTGLAGAAALLWFTVWVYHRAIRRMSLRPRRFLVLALAVFSFTVVDGICEGFLLFANSPMCIVAWLSAGVLVAPGVRRE